MNEIPASLQILLGAFAAAVVFWLLLWLVGGFG